MVNINFNIFMVGKQKLYIMNCFSDVDLWSIWMVDMEIVSLDQRLSVLVYMHEFFFFKFIIF